MSRIYYGGRWSSPGTRLAYTSEHQSLAMLEYFVHLDKEDPPRDLVLAIADVPEDVAQNALTSTICLQTGEKPRRLLISPDWEIEFVQRREYCMFIVPSVLAPAENNRLISPRHPACRKIDIPEGAPLNYDPRMFAKKTGHGRRKRSEVMLSGKCCE